MGRIPSLVRGVLAAAVLALATTAASAQTYKQIIPGGDTVTGDVASSADVDRFPFRLVEGTKLTLTLKAGKGSLVKPTMTILGVDLQPDAAATAAMVTNSKGTSVVLKKFLIDETGMRWIEVRGAAGTTGAYSLVGKVTLPKGFVGIGGSAGGGASTTVEFTSPGNATASFVVAAVKGSLAVPEFDSLKDPKGGNINIDYDVPSKKGFGVKGVPLPEPGKHALKVKSAGAGDFTVKVKWKVLKPVKKIVLEDQVITDPIPTALDPSSGDISETLEMTLDVAFAVQGAKITFKKGTTAITVQPGAIDVGADTATFGLVLASFQKGTYDLEIENPDKGKGLLPAALSIVLSPAEITSVSPDHGFANQTAAVITVNGKYMNTGATIELSRGLETIPGTGVTGVATALQATFDLTGHTWGLYDVTVTNPGVVPTTIPDAYEIRNPLPIVSSISPENNGDGDVLACYITGAEFDPTPTVFLRMAGEADIPGTDVIFGSDTELTATFDTTGAKPGSWDLHVVNPDLGEGTLSAAFSVSGPVGGPSNILDASYDIDSPPALVYNSTLDEFALAYIDQNASVCDVWIRKLDASGAANGSAVQVSNSASSVRKRDVDIAWDFENNQYCVVWAEQASNFNGQIAFSIFAQRVGAVDLSLQSATNVKVGDHVAAGGYYMDLYHSSRPSICWDATNNFWNMIWMCEYNTTDDLDMHQRTMSSTDVLQTPTGPGVTGAHEAEPTIAFDPVAGSVVTCHRYRSSSTGVINIRMGSTLLATDSVHQKDPDIEIDSDTGRAIITWTQAPTGSAMSVKGGTFNGASAVGPLVVIGSGGGDHFYVRKAYNSKTKETLFAWTRKDSGGFLTVLTRRAKTAGSGLTLIASEHEPSVGATDEATPFVGANSASGQTIAFWMKTMGLGTSAGLHYYNNTATGGGPAIPGQYRGKEIWRQRYQ